MALSKRLRYEVLRRDNHACRYCGWSAPDVRLTVDHVVPSALGGADTADNLVAACEGCNAGKAASNPGDELVEDVKQDAVRWARARSLAAQYVRESIDQRNRDIDHFTEYWDDAFLAEGAPIPDLPEDVQQSVGYWMDCGLSMSDLYGLVDTAVIPKLGKVHWNNLWNYFAGCCWARVRRIESAAQELIEIDQGVK